MSIEQLLFFLLLIAIPLLERLVRGMRARSDGSPAERTPASAESTVSPPPIPVSAPHRGARVPERLGTDLPVSGLPLPPALPTERQRAAAVALPTSERGPGMRRQREDRPATVRARHPDRPAAVQRSIARGDLRRAIVLIAILGPCRALEPKDAAQPS